MHTLVAAAAPVGVTVPVVPYEPGYKKMKLSLYFGIPIIILEINLPAGQYVTVEVVFVATLPVLEASMQVASVAPELVPGTLG